ncbi:MAG TPA: YihY family inner membrane protein [Immundisolibacter sp.]|nr:YihY family inner membrane protein [Immundisolibacter sp.]
MTTTSPSRVRALLAGLRFIGRRLSQERITQTAASLTFTTVISLVPLLAVMLAVFTAFPAFDELRGRLQDWFAHALLPPNIAEAVFGYLNQFAEKAAGLGAAGVIGLLVTATLLLLTVDRSLNLIWRTSRPRPFLQRVMLFWAWLTAGPLLMAFALGQLSLAAALSSGWLGAIPGATALLGTLVSWLVMGGLLAVVYRVVPNTEVLWRDALAGGVLAAVAFNLASRLFAWYIGRLPTYAAVYGTFATLPLALIWIYWSWLVVLGGAIVAAWLPALRSGVMARSAPVGGDFLLALQVLRRLAATRQPPLCGLDMATLARGLAADPQRLEGVLQSLEALGWVGQVRSAQHRRVRWVLLIDPQVATLRPLVDHLLLDREAAARAGLLPGSLFNDEVLDRTLQDCLGHERGDDGAVAADGEAGLRLIGAGPSATLAGKPAHGPGAAGS